MILICDKEHSERGVALREKLFKLGFPCCFSTISEIFECVPFKLIVTFGDVFDKIRRAPYDDVHVIVIGDIFVNSALNAEQVNGEDELILLILQRIYEILGAEPDIRYKFGVRIREWFVCKYFVEYYGKIIFLTQTEFMIFKYMILCNNDGTPIPAKVILKYCTTDKAGSFQVSLNKAAVNIKNLNDKLSKVIPNPMIKSSRGRGYYVDMTTVSDVNI